MGRSEVIHQFFILYSTFKQKQLMIMLKSFEISIFLISE